VHTAVDKIMKQRTLQKSPTQAYST